MNYQAFRGMTDIKKWAIVSWQHVDHLDDKYGRLLDVVEGNYDQACIAARNWLPDYAPISVCRIIEP